MNSDVTMSVYVSENELQQSSYLVVLLWQSNCCKGFVAPVDSLLIYTTGFLLCLLPALTYLGGQSLAPMLLNWFYHKLHKILVKR